MNAGNISVHNCYYADDIFNPDRLSEIIVNGTIG